jgi:UDP-N-acetylglucosamine acyltransferase
MAKIHETAIVDPAATLADDVEIGAWSIIGPDVTIGEGCWIGPHVIITGRTTLGRDNRVFQFNSIGEQPQDKKYAGEDTELVIGDRNLIREFCTLNRGTVQDGGVTRIGDDNWIMAYVHIAHDCQLGNHIIMGNNASLAGHVTVGDWAILSGFSQIHQFCEIGAHAFISFNALINRSVPPYVTVSPEKSHPRGVNTEGLRRRGFSSEQIQNVRRAYRVLYRSGHTLDKAREELADMATDAEELQIVVDFIDHAERSIIR